MEGGGGGHGSGTGVGLGAGRGISLGFGIRSGFLSRVGISSGTLRGGISVIITARIARVNQKTTSMDRNKSGLLTVDLIVVPSNSLPVLSRLAQ